MNLNELQEKVKDVIQQFTRTGEFPKENNIIDYKKQLNTFDLSTDSDVVEIFSRNFVKDILSFGNSDGGIIFFGFNENETTGKIDDIGLDSINLNILKKIDLNHITQKFEGITKVGVSIDLQPFQITSRKYYYLLIAKQYQTLIPLRDFKEYKIHKGEIIYRATGKNEVANKSTQDFNRFIQLQASEKNKDFISIWSLVFPEMVEINPREVLIINPKTNKVYGFNGKDKELSSAEIDIDKAKDGAFNIILNAISAGEIGKITDNEGKPIYKLMGELQGTSTKDFISISTLKTEVEKLVVYKFTSTQLKSVIYYLGWTNSKSFKVNNPPKDTTNKEYQEFVWVDTLDKITDRKKVVFSIKSIDKIKEVVNNKELHLQLFNKILDSSLL